MNSEEFKKQIKKELSGRPVGSVELLQYENWAKINKLQNEVVLKAVIFAKTIKGPAINKSYIMAILNNWLDLEITTPNDVNSFLLSKPFYLTSVRESALKKKALSHKIINKEYTKEEITKMIEKINKVELW